MEWINANYNLPSHNEIVLLYDEQNTFISIGKLTEDDEFLLMYVEKVEGDSIITHWMYLPEPPKEND